MILQLLLQVFLFLLSWPVKSLAKSRPLPPPLLTRPNCPTHCGNNVTIPFPFGIGSDCYFDDMYAIDCISHKPFLRSIKLEVLQFSLEKSTMRVNQSVIYSCQQSKKTISLVNLNDFPFYFSFYLNKFTGVGCNNVALMSSADSLSNSFYTVGGCFSICNEKNRTENDSCNGLNCCQTGVPWALKSLNIAVSNINNETRSSNSSRQQEEGCKYAFLVEQDWFDDNFRRPKDVQNWKQVPVVLDWRIYNTSFDKLAMNTSPRYSGSTFDCKTDDSGLVFCYCHGGYHGNPYFLQECQDIDECKNSSICDSDMVCQNSRGSYRCINRDGPKVSVIILGIGTGLGGLLLLIGVCWIGMKIIKKMKKKEENFKRNGGLLLQQQLSSSDGSVDRCKIFSVDELEKATDYFNVNRILGQGGQGTVYKGMLADGRIIAVKKSKVVDEPKLEEFINEVVILSQISHRNVVKLLGCCLEIEVPLLVYEFIPNGTLSQYIHDQNEELPLTWEMRLRIATEVADALSYLHSAAYLPIFHRDIKSTNILLDEKYRAKIADFGTSRSISFDQTHVSTKVQGTFGYLDPEYFHSSQFTDKSDVYSFGVVLVELLTGEKPLSATWTKEGRNLATCFVEYMEENCVNDILDNQVKNLGRKEDIMAVANLAKRCLNPSGKKRPTMKEVAMELERIKVSENGSNVQKCFEEVEYVRTESLEPWDIASPSTNSTTVVG
ncbi:Wall-associated receptor kinase [Melia azedarach]|uniref:Wall-associated receptor kinase n=1 Tax=Melia azedarach TaxID=155640 RepID=A0ACC1Y243_MELAZ|nr:Wall-associated receptor kinase [Melia azedarach]